MSLDTIEASGDNLINGKHVRFDLTNVKHTPPANIASRGTGDSHKSRKRMCLPDTESLNKDNKKLRGSLQTCTDPLPVKDKTSLKNTSNDRSRFY